MARFVASFYIGEIDGDHDFEIQESTLYVSKNWRTLAQAKLEFENLEIKSNSITDEVAFDDEDGTYLLYLDAKFEVNNEQKKLLASMYEFDAPNSVLFKLECGQYVFECGDVEEVP
jgi:hypothetical protein